MQAIYTRTMRVKDDMLGKAIALPSMSSFTLIVLV